MSSYPPDPACAAELEQATTPDAKRAILEKHGWTCDKKGDRWTYRKGDGRVIKSLTTLVKELSNDDPFASGSDDDDAKDANGRGRTRPYSDKYVDGRGRTRTGVDGRGRTRTDARA